VLPGLLRRARQLTVRELCQIAVYAVQLGAVRAVLARRRLEPLVQRWHRTDDRGPVSLADARREARLVHLAARGAPWSGNCLHRSVVLWRRLQRLGTSGRLRLGVRARPGARPDFHAWVELDGVVLNDRPDIGELYRVLADATPLRAAPRASAVTAATSSGNRSRSEA
jgi:hypothetical protein